MRDCHGWLEHSQIISKYPISFLKSSCSRDDYVSAGMEKVRHASHWMSFLITVKWHCSERPFWHFLEYGESSDRSLLLCTPGLCTCSLETAVVPIAHMCSTQKLQYVQSNHPNRNIRMVEGLISSLDMS